MTNYNGPDGFTAHCHTCGHPKISHSFVGSRCPGTFEREPVVQEEVRMAAQHEAARTAALHAPTTTEERGKQIDSAEWVARVSDALVAARELVDAIDSSDYGHCHGCAAPLPGRHFPDCYYDKLRERILAAS